MQKSDWKKCKLGDVCKFQNGKKPSFSERGTFPVYGGNGAYGFSDFSNAKPGNIVIGRVGAYCGSLYYLTMPSWITDNAILATPSTHERFLFYLLRSKNLNRMSQGGAQPLLNQSILNGIEINLPPLEEQKRIAGILGALDDKIELLQKQNKTLEDMAKAIFKSWFVDFDVVHAKAALTSNSNLSPLRGKCHEGAKGGQNQEQLVPTHQLYTKHIKNLVRAMRQNLTPQEVKLWQHLRKERLGVKFRRQFPIDSKYIADFACVEKKLIIELDGSQHAEKQQDKERTLYLEDNGFTVLRFWNNEIDNNLMGCLEEIRKYIICPPCGENVGLPTKRGYENKETTANNYPPTPPNGGTSPARGADNGKGGQIKTKADIMREYHLTEELYDLFPSDFENSSLGPIPLGWQVKTVQDVAKVVGGGTPSTKEPAYFAQKGTAIPWLTPKDLSGYSHKYISHGQTDITQEGLNKSSAQLMPPNSIVFSSRAPIGYIAISLEDITTNQGFKSLVPQKVQYTEFLYQYLCYHKQTIENLGTGSTFKEVSGSVMKNISLCFPNDSILKVYEEKNTVVNKKLKNNLKQIQTLTELRDTLLAPLISGKIRV